MARFFSFLLLFFLLFNRDRLSAQLLLPGDNDSLQSSVTDISKILFSEKLENKFEFSYFDFKASLGDKYQSLHFNNGPIHKQHIPDSYVTKKAILRFRICNSSDSAKSVWFFPGLYYWDTQLYEETKTGLKKLPSILPDEPEESAIASLQFRRGILPLSLPNCIL
jgi:hypothetical protein